MRAAIVFPILLVAATAAAERPQPRLKWIAPPTARATAAATPSSKIIFVHRCPVTGCLIKPGTEDSRTDTSSIADMQTTISQFKQGDMVWQKMMTCVKNAYAPFDITVTDVDPGDVPHYENIVGGKISELTTDPGLAGAGGVSPFTCGEIPNSVSFTFDVYGADPDQLCWTVSQETAHSFGLEHEYNANDPLTYIAGGPSMKRFQAADSPCGTYSALSQCQCPPLHTTQNSYKWIVDMFGPGAAVPPTVAIKAPTDGKKVQPHFQVRVNAEDDVAVDHVELWIDGAQTDVRAMTAPYKLVAPDGIEDGPHTVEARAIDVQGVPASAMIDVDMGPPCTAGGGCQGDDVCVMGTCLPGPDVPGGLGFFCSANTECLSNQCAGNGGGKSLCVESCDTSVSGACPNDFSCIDSGAGGVCWYNGDSGCCSAATPPGGPLLLGAGVLAALVLRRRRR